MLALQRFFKVCKVAFFEATFTPFSLRESKTYKPTLIWLSKSFLFAFCIMLSPYLQWFLESITMDYPRILASLVGLLGVVSILFTPKNRRFSVGFFVGILWFYWVGLGLRYFDMIFLIPLGTLFMGILVGFVFWIGLFCECLIVRFAFLMLLSFFEPLGFDWFILESFWFAYSYFGVDKLSFALIIVSVWLLITSHRYVKLVGIVCLLLALDKGTFQEVSPALPLKIKIIQTEVSQDIKNENLIRVVEENFAHIRHAALEGNDMVILPEAAFPFPLEKYKDIQKELETLSDSIAIVVGSLRLEVLDREEKYYNSTYIFDHGRMSAIDKVFLVPFGEEFPLFLQPIVERFFQGIGGFSRGKGLGEFEIKGVSFQNAICYEGTSRQIYEKSPPFVVVTSNNAWFVPSIEPILQKNLMKYYARLYGSTILHATNLSPSAIITP